MIEFERLSKILERVASRFSTESDEYEAIRVATLALFYVRREKILEEFNNFIETCEPPLTGKQLSALKKQGAIRDVE